MKIEWRKVLVHYIVIICILFPFIAETFICKKCCVLLDRRDVERTYLRFACYLETPAWIGGRGYILLF